MKLYSKLKDIRAKKGNKKGFTLVELIVVIVIILILAAVLVPSVLRYVDKANQANCKADAGAILVDIQAQVADKATTTAGDAKTVTKAAGVTVTHEPTHADFADKGTDKAAKYTVNAENDVTGFSYQNGQYYINWNEGTWSEVAK